MSDTKLSDSDIGADQDVDFTTSMSADRATFVPQVSGQLCSSPKDSHRRRRATMTRTERMESMVAAPLEPARVVSVDPRDIAAMQLVDSAKVMTLHGTPFDDNAGRLNASYGTRQLLQTLAVIQKTRDTDCMARAERFKRALMASVVVKHAQFMVALHEHLERARALRSLSLLLIPILMRRRLRVIARRRQHHHEGELVRPSALGLSEVAPFSCLASLHGLNQLLVDEMELVTYAAGEYILRQGECSNIIYFIASGECTEQSPSGAANAQRLSAGGWMGDIFGADSPRPAAIVAATPAICWRLTKTRFDAVLADAPESARVAIRQAYIQHCLVGIKDKFPLHTSLKELARVPILNRVSNTKGLMEDYLRSSSVSVAGPVVRGPQHCGWVSAGLHTGRFTPLMAECGDVVFTEGSRTDHVYLLLNGEVTLSQAPPPWVSRGPEGGAHRETPSPAASPPITPSKNISKESTSLLGAASQGTLPEFCWLGHHAALFQEPHAYRCVVKSPIAKFYMVERLPFLDMIVSEPGLLVALRVEMLRERARRMGPMPPEWLSYVPLCQFLPSSRRKAVAAAAIPRCVLQNAHITQQFGKVSGVMVVASGTVLHEPRPQDRTLHEAARAAWTAPPPERIAQNASEPDNHRPNGLGNSASRSSLPSLSVTLSARSQGSGRFDHLIDSDRLQNTVGDMRVVADTLISVLGASEMDSPSQHIAVPPPPHLLGTDGLAMSAVRYVFGGRWEGLVAEQWNGTFVADTLVEYWELPVAAIRRAYEALPQPQQHQMLAFARRHQKNDLGLEALVSAPLAPLPAPPRAPMAARRVSRVQTARPGIRMRDHQSPNNRTPSSVAFSAQASTRSSSGKDSANNESARQQPASDAEAAPQHTYRRASTVAAERDVDERLLLSDGQLNATALLERIAQMRADAAREKARHESLLIAAAVCGARSKAEAEVIKENMRWRLRHDATRSDARQRRSDWAPHPPASPRRDSKVAASEESARRQRAAALEREAAYEQIVTDAVCEHDAFSRGGPSPQSQALHRRLMHTALTPRNIIHNAPERRRPASATAISVSPRRFQSHREHPPRHMPAAPMPHPLPYISASLVDNF